MAVKSSRRTVVQLARPTLRETIGRLAPGTALRDGLERILRGRTGALIVLGYDDAVETICDGGFSLDVAYAPTRLRELSKMDGAVVLSTDGTRILRANVQLVPDPSIPTDESGTRHRSAERTAVQTGYPVISVSHSMSIVTVYVAGERHVVPDSATILQRANQTIDTLERYKSRLDEVSRQLSTAEIEDFVTLRDVMTVVQRLEMVRRISLEIDADVVELGTDGRQLKLQLEELVGDNDTARELIVRDYHANPDPPTPAQVTTEVTWTGMGSAPNCPLPRQPIGPGTYNLMVQLGNLRSASVPFVLAAQPPPAGEAPPPAQGAPAPEQAPAPAG